MTNWDAHDARAVGLTPKDEAALIQRMAKDRAMEALRHRATSCWCCGCRVRQWAAKRQLAKDYAATLDAGYIESDKAFAARIGGRP